MKDVIVTGDRPTGHLHLGHYVGSLRNRKKLMDDGKYEMYIFSADMQGLTDNARDVSKIKENVFEVIKDNLSVGIDPEKVTVFVQSGVPELTELTTFYANLVTLSRLKRNPTVKDEIKQRGFEESIPVGFMTYPISQAADVTAFDATIVPVGEDQIPIMEQVNEIVDSFNKLYGETLVRPKVLLPSNDSSRRLPGIDGKAKMSKSLNNCIYLTDDSETVRKKVMSMFTDPNHIRVEDPGNTKDNPVFIYLDALATDRDKFNELKEHYERGGLGDKVVKEYLYEVIEEVLTPIRERRKYYDEHPEVVERIIKEGTLKARRKASEVLLRVRKAVGVEYFM